MISKQPINYPPPEIPFPFGVPFQMKLLKLLMLDGGLVDEAMRHLQPHYFETPELRWVCQRVQDYNNAYGGVPSIEVLRQISKYEQKLGHTLVPVLEQMDAANLQEEKFLKDHFLDWVKQNLFHQSFREATGLWNNGKRQDAIDHMQKKMEEVERVFWEKHDDEWLMSNIGQRQLAREHAWEDQIKPAIPTGIHQLDLILDGGLSPGELGIWIAYAKGGKSTLLMNHGAQAARFYKRVMHVILEGSKDLIANRYDAFFSQQAYGQVKKGGMDGAAYSALVQEYKILKDKILLVPMLDKWDYSILDLDARLKHYKRAHGWVPEMIIVDYGDLMHGRNGPYAAPWMSERDCFRDLKLISNRGFAVWTASQAQRPTTKSYNEHIHEIQVAQIAGGIEKVRVADFVGSINMTLEEKAGGLARLWAEVYRDNAAGKVIPLNTNLNHMAFVGVDAVQPSEHVHPGPVQKGIGLGYQTKGA